MIRGSRSDNTVSRDPGQRALAETANLGHVPSYLWSLLDTTEELGQQEQLIDGEVKLGFLKLLLTMLG